MAAMQSDAERLPLHFSLWSTIIVGGLLLLSINSWYSTRSRLNKVGSMAPMVPYRAPLGIDVFATCISKMVHHDFFEWTRQLFNNHGRTVVLNMIGRKLLLTDDPENTKAILSSNAANFGKGDAFHDIWYDLMFDSIFSTEGHRWHENKNMLNDHISKVRASDYAVTERHVPALVRNLSNGEPCDCLDQIDRFTMDVVTDIFFGASAGTLSAERQPVRHAVEEIYEWNSKRILFGRLGLLLPGCKKASSVITAYLDKAISDQKLLQARDGSEETERRSHTLLGSLLAQKVPEKRIKDQMMAILIGGKDPGSITIVWALYELARNPNIVKSLREEIASKIGLSTPPTASQLKSLTILQNTIKETLRMHAPVGFNIRATLNDTSLPTGGGADGKERIGVLKGTNVLMSYIGTQRREDIVGPTANAFDPARWNTWTPQTWEYLPFNHGSRPCLGRNFAWMQMEYLLCRLFQEFEGLELVDKSGKTVLGSEEMKIKIALNTKPAEPVMLRFFKSVGRDAGL